MYELNTSRPEMVERDCALCIKIWPALKQEVYSSDQYITLAAHVRAEMKEIRIPLSNIFPGVEEIDNMSIAMAHVKELENQPVESVVNALRDRASLHGQLYEPEKDILSAAASMSTMAKIQIRSLTGAEPERTTFWGAGTSLNDTARNIFQGKRAVEDCSITQKLTVSNLARYYQCKVYWTDHLDMHLEYQVVRGAKVLSVFQHKVWLSAHLDQSSLCTVPQEIICEALDTLNLLFPQNNPDTERFLRKRDQKFYSLGYCGRDRKLNLRDYPHWGPKIKRLMGVLEGPRSGIWRFLPRHDKSDLLESANFWIATAAAFLAFVGFLLGLTSIIYAKWSYDVGVKSMAISEESLDLTRLQYKLSLAQACSDPNEARLLPDFCSAEE